MESEFAELRGVTLAALTYQAEFSGWLVKKSKWLKQWRKRFFLLRGSRLYYSKGPDMLPHGFIDLAAVTNVQSCESEADKPYSFQITTLETTYHLVASSTDEKETWIGLVGRAVSRNISYAED